MQNRAKKRPNQTPYQNKSERKKTYHGRSLQSGSSVCMDTGKWYPVRASGAAENIQEARPSLPRKERLCSHHSDHTQLSYSPVWHGPHPGMLYHCCTVSQTTCLLPASSSSIRKVFGRWRKPRLRLRAISRFPQLACGGAPVRPKMSALLLEES